MMEKSSGGGSQLTQSKRWKTEWIWICPFVEKRASRPNAVTAAIRGYQGVISDTLASDFHMFDMTIMQKLVASDSCITGR